ncbi:MAG: hypothetical protein AB2693_25120, partial [Candidatus Thiodiazotropha sp.]
FFRDLTNDQNFLLFSFFSGAVGIRGISLKRGDIGNISVLLIHPWLGLCQTCLYGTRHYKYHNKHLPETYGICSE